MFTNSINQLQKHIHSIFINRITIITLLVSILFTFNTLYFQSIGKGISIYSGLFQTTVQSHSVEILLLIVGSIILMAWPNFSLPSEARNNLAVSGLAALVQEESGAERFQKSDKSRPLMLANLSSLRNTSDKKISFVSQADQYSLIGIFSILGGSLLMSSLDLLSMYLSIELQSFALYILATLNKEKLSATSAGLKYFLLGSLSSCFILLGSAIIYSYTGLTQFEAINTLISCASDKGLLTQVTNIAYPMKGEPLTCFTEGPFNLQSSLGSNINKAFTIGLIIILIGFLFKISAAPFYQWAPALCYRKTHEWDELSNSGDSLKLLIPSISRKINCGWSNYPCMVTSQKMIENEMGYRGSKSVLLNNTVKEQRVDGSWFLAKKTRSLRYTLMGCESSYQIKIPSKQLNTLYFSTLINNNLYNIACAPWFFTGFIDAEGCFQISIRQDKNYKTNWRVSLTFQIKQHVKDITLLNNFKKE